MSINKNKVFITIQKTHGSLEDLADAIMESLQKLSPEDQKEWYEQVSKKPNRTLEGEWIH